MPYSAASATSGRALAPPVAERSSRRRPVARRVSRTGRWAMLATCTTAMLGTLTACSLPNLSMSSDVRKSTTPATTSHASARPSAVASSSAKRASAAPTAVTPTSAVVRPAGALDTGSVTHKVAVGAFSAVIVYYTADVAKLYRNSSTKTIRVAVHLEGASSTPNILVNNFIATADDGMTRAIVKQDPRSFAITPPQSYNSVVTIPATTHASTAVQLIVELDLSVQIKPASKLYAAQTALDSITLPLLPGSHP